MATEIKMPRFGMTMKQGKLAKWFKQEGDTVEKGESLFEVETEKITNTVQAIASGILFQIVVQVGETVPVGAVLAVVADEGETPERIEGIKVGEVEDVEAASRALSGPPHPAPDMPPAEAIQFLLDRMKRVDTNQEFLDSMAAGG